MYIDLLSRGLSLRMKIRLKSLFERHFLAGPVAVSIVDKVENPMFQELLFYLCAVLTIFLPTSGNTIRQWIISDFKRRRGQIRKELHLSKSLVHLSFDLWTSPNSLAMLAVVGHFVSHVGEAKSCLLGLRHVEGCAFWRKYGRVSYCRYRRIRDHRYSWILYTR